MYFYLYGAGRVRPERAVLSDVLDPLIRLYRTVRDAPEDFMRAVDAETRASSLNGDPPNSRERYEEARAQLNDMLRPEHRAIKEGVGYAALFLYLNKMGFNGLCRFSKPKDGSLQGTYNTPYGHNPNRAVCDRDNILACSTALQGADLRVASYYSLLDDAQPGDVIYLDPPYVPLSATSNFTGYSAGSWRAEEHEDLADMFRSLDDRGCLLVMSNSDTPLTRELYAGFDLVEVKAPRRVAAKAEARVTTGELVIRNVSRW